MSVAGRLPEPSTPLAVARLPADQIAAAAEFAAMWETHRETSERLRAIRHTLGVRGFHTLLKLVVDRRDLTEAGFPPDRRGRETGRDFLSHTLAALARLQKPRSGRKEAR